MDDGTVANIGDLSKAATVLVEKVCNAVGILYEPTRIRRQAKADADAEKIATLAKIELRDIEYRALQRLAHQEARKQENIESITSQAAKALPENAKVEALEEDWVAHFFKQCDTVSDKEMQSLWAKLLAGEATQPGTFSKRTVDFVSSLDKKDAATFTSFCQYVWMMGELCPLIYDIQNEIYSTQGITFTALKHLDSIGLISFESISGYSRQGFGKYAYPFYYGIPTLIEFQEDSGNQIDIGHAMLTSIGKELAPICGSVKNEAFHEYVIKTWFDRGLIVSSLIKHH
jgi:Protein of unknown function (DUF2806)